MLNRHDLLREAATATAAAVTCCYKLQNLNSTVLLDTGL